MQIKRNDSVLWFSLILLLSIIKSSYQTLYTCNTTASCGCSSNEVLISRIVGGENASPGAWTWAVSISINGMYLCGGSILSSSWVITAAHCVTGYQAWQITIYAGSIIPYYGTQTSVGSQVIIHPAYDSNTYANDIALLQLNSPLNMNDPYVGTICLPSVSSSILSAGEWPPVGTTVIAIGWGTLSQGGPLPTSLQQVTLFTVAYNASTCAPSMADWHVQLCAGVPGGGKDTCQGDSGGPLMMFAPSQQWVLVGLTSSGIGCAEAAYSGVYTRVAAFQDWINSNTNGTVPTTVSTTAKTTARTTASKTVRTTTTYAIIDSHANTVETSIIAIFIFSLFDLLIVYFY